MQSVVKINLHNQKGEVIGEKELNSRVFGVPANHDLIHQAVVAQLANARRTIAHTKQRGEVRGGGKKPWKQKGTGRARAGSTRSPIWVGGGRAHGPKPKSWEQKLPKKMRKLGVRMALANRIQNDALGLLADIEKAQPKTSWAEKFCAGFGDRNRVLVVAGNAKRGDAIRQAFANLPNCDVLPEAGLNVRDILNHQICLIDTEAVALIEGRLSAGR